MIIDMPFRYFVDGTRKGRLRPSQYAVWETTQVEIREISGSDAPVAVSWNDSFPDLLRADQYAPTEWGQHNADGNAHTVMFEGSHWVALDNSANTFNPAAGPYGPCLTHEVARGLERDGSCDLFGLEEDKFDRKARKQIADNPDNGHETFDTVKTSSRQRSLKALRVQGASLISVDGRLYQRCREPQLWIMQGTVHQDRTTAGETFQVALVRVDVHGRPRSNRRAITPGGRHYFGLGEIDEVLRLASEFHEGGRYADVADARNETTQPVISHHHAFDEDANRLGRVADLGQQVVNYMDGRRYRDIPRATVRLLADFEDAIEALGSGEGLALFEEAAARLHENISVADHPQHSAMQFLSPLVEILDSRDISLDLDVNRSPAP